MFKSGDAVIYGTHGVCTVVDTKVFDFTGSDKNYYVLLPLNEKIEIYVPCDNELLLSRMSPVLTTEEVDGVIDSLITSDDSWIESDSARKEYCSEVVKSGNRDKLIRMIHMLQNKQKELASAKKHFHLTDERFLKEGERLLHEEFAYVLGISVSDVADYIEKRLEKD